MRSNRKLVVGSALSPVCHIYCTASSETGEQSQAAGSLTRKGAASQSARPPAASPGWFPRSRCCLGAARWSIRSWGGCCWGSRGGAAGARWPRSPLKIPVWPDQQRSYQWSSQHWSRDKRKKNKRHRLLQSNSCEMTHHVIGVWSPHSWELFCWNIYHYEILLCLSKIIYYLEVTIFCS